MLKNENANDENASDKNDKDNKHVRRTAMTTTRTTIS